MQKKSEKIVVRELKCYAVEADTAAVQFFVKALSPISPEPKYINMALDRGMAVDIPGMDGYVYCPNGTVQCADDGQALYLNGVLAPGAVFRR
jgi:hypothetical protein